MKSSTEPRPLPVGSTPDRPRPEAPLLRILLADDHEVVREGLRTVLQARPGWHVVGEATTGREAVEQALRLKPQVVVLDITLPELNGLDAARRIRTALPETEVLILTVHNSERLAHQALLAGAKGFVLKSDPKQQLVAAVEALARHQSCLTPEISAMVLRGFIHPDRQPVSDAEAMDRLTPREREVVQLIAQGRTTKEIAASLHVSVKTVDAHRGNIMRKLDLHSAVEIARYAIRNKITEA